MDIQFSQHHLLKRLSFLHCEFLALLSKVHIYSWSSMHGCMSGISILFRCSCLFLYLYHIVFITVVLQCNLISESVRAPALYFFLKIDLATPDPLWFYMNFRSIFPMSEKIFQWDFNRICIESVDPLNSMDILTILSLLIHGHGISSH